MNKVRAKVFEEGKAVLIDTWWNVNSAVMMSTFVLYRRFNRYMVECESKNNQSVTVTDTSFNRYMVECECISDNIRLSYHHRFNRYMVECEWVQMRLWMSKGILF